MDRPYAKMIKESYELKEGRKTVYNLIKTEEEYFTETQYKNYIDAAPFFRRLGGSETLERSYTCAGYNVDKITSKSPDRTKKNVARFYFWNHSKNKYDEY